MNTIDFCKICDDLGMERYDNHCDVNEFITFRTKMGLDYLITASHFKSRALVVYSVIYDTVVEQKECFTKLQLSSVIRNFINKGKMATGK